jgi:hypothetical protein
VGKNGSLSGFIGRAIPAAARAATKAYRLERREQVWFILKSAVEPRKTRNITETERLATSIGFTQLTIMTAFVNSFSSVNFRVFRGFQLPVLGLWLAQTEKALRAIRQRRCEFE